MIFSQTEINARTMPNHVKIKENLKENVQKCLTMSKWLAILYPKQGLAPRLSVLRKHARSQTVPAGQGTVTDHAC